MEFKKTRFHRKILSLLPLTLLYLSVLNNFDFNYLGLIYFSFNFSYILIFYYNLKKSNGLGYVYIFIAGLFNDVIVGTPIGISSLVYLLLCGAAAYLRNITLRPSLMKDWIFFLITILILNSLFFTILTLIFDYEVNYIYQLTNIIFTSLFYFIFSYFFSFFDNIILGKSNVR
jgi:rod shape-determining protein MreD